MTVMQKVNKILFNLYAAAEAEARKKQKLAD